MSDLRVTNLRGRTPGSSPILPDGVEIAGIVTAKAGAAVTYYGDGSNLTGIDASALKDSDNTIRVQANTSGVVVTGVLTATSFSGIDASSLSDSNSATRVQATTSGAVVTGVLTATSFSGDGSALTFAPKVVAFDPAALSTGVAADTNITITFDQNIQFAGTGTIELRSASASGTLIESFAITSGTPASGLSISGTQLIINPTSNLSDNTVVYVILPNQGIQATSGGSYYAGSNNYNFRTAQQTFSVQGGDSVWTTTDSNSPTGYYRYHVFEDENNIGVATFSADTTQAIDMFVLMVAGGGAGGRSGAMPGSPRNFGGGGGAGGVRTFTGPTLNLPAGTYNVGVGSGGNAMPGVIENSPRPDFDAALPQINGTPSRIYNGQITVQSIGGGGGATGLTPSDSNNDHAVQSGGSGGGGFGLWDPAGTPAPLTIPGADGVTGQGYPGGIGKNFTAATGSASYDIGVSGGGGGAGGAGGDGTRITASPTNSHVGGAGGPGVAVPQFNNSVLLGNTNIPADSIARIGPTGLYGGGGGGVGGPGPGAGAAGKGGPGGGGDGSPWQGTADVYINNNYADPGNGQSGVEFTGGGGGAGNNSQNGAGGQGVIIIRYATNL